MEDFSIRAIVIGVSLFVTIMTLSAIVVYFNTARSAADIVNKRTDIASSYDDIVNGENYQATLTGVDIRSLINKYAENKKVEINIVSISGIDTDKYLNINNRYIDDEGWLVRVNEDVSLISEEKLNIVNPSWNNTVNKVEKSNKTILEISLNVKD